MLLRLEDYRDRAMNPADVFIPFAQSDEQLRAAALSPAAQVPAELATNLVRSRTQSMLRLQQHLIYRVGQTLGILGPAVPAVVDVLQEIAPILAADINMIIEEAIATATGIAADALGAIPIVGLCVKAAAAGVQLGLMLDRALNTPGTMIGLSLVDAQQYSTDADASLANSRVIPQAETRDWTSLFMPSMRGQLHAQIRKNQGGNIVIAWGLREGGKVPRVVIDKRPVFSTYTWHFSENNGNAEGGPGANPFTPTGGLGAVPGTTQILDVTQSAFLEPQNLHRGHETLGDPRCGSTRKTSDVNVGSWYPSTANGAWSLFGYATKASASTYTIATQEVVNAWQAAMDAIWEGVEKLWRNPSWEGGYGCGPWQNALQGLVAAHCVGSDNLIGGFGAWMPTRYQTKLTTADRDAWEKNNLCTRIVKPAMMDLREMQLNLLRKTPMAAYLPASGLGSMRDVSVKDEFGKNRAMILSMRHRSAKVLLPDVIDESYRAELDARGLGTNSGHGGINTSEYKPPRIAVPKIIDGKVGAVPSGGAGGIIIGGLALFLAIKLLR